MAEWEEINQGKVYPFEKEGDSIEGKLVAKQAGINDSENYIIQTQNGEEFLVWGCAVLKTKMAGIKEGSPVKLTFLGEKKSSTSNRMYKDFKVETKK